MFETQTYHRRLIQRLWVSRLAALVADESLISM